MGWWPKYLGPCQTWEVQIEFQAPSFGQVQLWLLWPFREWASGWKISVSPSLSVTLPFKWINILLKRRKRWLPAARGREGEGWGKERCWSKGTNFVRWEEKTLVIYYIEWWPQLTKMCIWMLLTQIFNIVTIKKVRLVEMVNMLISLIKSFYSIYVDENITLFPTYPVLICQLNFQKSLKFFYN